MGDADQTAITAHLKQLYAEYRHTAELETKARFFSPDCRQICRTNADFAAKDRDTIMRYLRETSGKEVENIHQLVENPDKKPDVVGQATDTPAGVGVKKKSFYTIRPLRDDEMEFGSDEIVVPAGFNSAADTKLQADREQWLGMRVDLWDDEGIDDEGRSKGILVKVQYWWRKDADVWLQILHDIMYLGPRDGTEGSEGDTLE